ncbi:hypothetical protein [Aquabacterium sp.]|uniref:hypothetical protein n=1 Tax=Aquabacterium sp. TaxID=1872578 RepID=UPI0035AF3CE3
MTPQAHFTLVAPLAAGREASLRALLATMNATPGTADPYNSVLPFAAIERLHFARLVVLDDALQVDLDRLGVPRPRLPTVLSFMGDCDGPAQEVLAELVQHAGEGLRRIFAHCEGFGADTDLLDWMQAHDRPIAASYVNWVGRTVRQIKEESALQRALSATVSRAAVNSGAQARALHTELRSFVNGEARAGRLVLTPDAPTPLAWRVAKIAHLLAVPLVGLLALPILIVLSPLLIYLLRTRETTDPEICHRPQAKALGELQVLEDIDVSNQYTAIGAVKPGLFRRWLVSALLVLINYACRHVFTCGFLARVQTIHFARWVFIDDKTRVVFTSNYDGSHQGYMDDFINKVAWGLNLVFSNGVGWPRTRWLILGGARIEQDFKRYQRRHQVPTQVWYKAYPGLSLHDLTRNQRIREGLENTQMSDAQTLAWLRLL